MPSQGMCAAYAKRLTLRNPDEHVLPEIISKERFGPLVRHGDCSDIVRWTHYAIIPELGVTKRERMHRCERMRAGTIRSHLLRREKHRPL